MWVGGVGKYVYLYGKIGDMPYANWTYNARNPLQRFSHRRRFEKSCRLIGGLLGDNGSLLDYGCADGYLLSKLRETLPRTVTLHGFEPFPDSKVDESLVIFNDECELQGRTYDVVSCCEVLEHFSAEGSVRLIEAMRQRLKPGGLLVVSVPVEGGPAGLFKGLLRKTFDRRLRHQYTWRNLWRTLWYMPLDEWRQGDGYLDHIGFYFRDLRPRLERDFELLRIEYSPMPVRGQAFNSQIYAIFRRKA